MSASEIHSKAEGLEHTGLGERTGVYTFETPFNGQLFDLALGAGIVTAEKSTAFPARIPDFP